MKLLDLKVFAMRTARLLRRDVSAAFSAEFNHLKHLTQENEPYLVFPVSRGRFNNSFEGSH